MNTTQHAMDTTEHTINNLDHMNKMKKAELLSSIGAGVLGAGIGVLLTNILARFAVPILVLGLASHAMGMARMRSLENQGNITRVGWMEVVYWFCWLALAALLVYIVIGLF